MTPDIFAEWLRRQGIPVLHSESSLWYRAGPRIFQAFPYHWTITPSSEELRSVLSNAGALGLRYSTPLASPFGRVSYHVVYQAECFPLECLPKKARNAVRRGLSASRVEPVTFSRLAEQGWALRADTLSRQGRRGAESSASWRQLCQAADGLPGFEAWAAIVDDELAASLIAFIDVSRPGEVCASILFQQSRSEYLSHGVNNALAYSFTGSILERWPGAVVFYGLHSLDAPPSVDQFKFRMGYTARPVRQRVVFHPVLAPLFNPASHFLLRLLRSLRPGSSTLAKAEGLVRFYLEGRRPLERQSWPPPLLPPSAAG